MARVEIESINFIADVSAYDASKEISRLTEPEEEGVVVTCLNFYPTSEGMKGVRRVFRPQKILQSKNPEKQLEDLFERMQTADLVVERKERRIEE